MDFWDVLQHPTNSQVLHLQYVLKYREADNIQKYETRHIPCDKEENINEEKDFPQYQIFRQYF